MEVRKECDDKFVLDLLESVFQIDATDGDIKKCFQLGRPIEGSDTPHPLLVSFKKW